MPITRSQQRELDRKERERKALLKAVQDSLSKWPINVDNLVDNMNILTTTDDSSLHRPVSKYHQGRLLGREHTDPVDRPLNMDPPTSKDTSNVPKFTAAAKAAYQANRSESLFDTSDNDVYSSTEFFSSSSGEGMTVLSNPGSTLRTLSVLSELDPIRFSSDEQQSFISESSTVGNFSISDRPSP